ncbi:MAG: glycosyltransferase, partial [Candidatus Woesearchaeota archaeon]
MFLEESVNFLVWMVYLLSLYFTIYFFILLLDNNDREPSKEVITKEGSFDLKNKFPEFTVIIPAYNEEETIKPTVESVFNLDYPKDKLNVICVNDGSSDNTLNVLKELKEDYPIKIIDQVNQGKYMAMNNALKEVNTPFFACLDADSFIKKDALKTILFDFDDLDVASSLPAMKVSSPKNTLEIMQWLEYLVNIFYKKLLEIVNCIHVAPGPFSVYRTDVVKDIGGFRKAHLTEDLEMAFRLQDHNYILRQNTDAIVLTKVPNTFKAFFKQRVRWYFGTIMNVLDYKHFFFNPKYGDFGFFFFPMVALTGLLTILGGGLMVYTFSERIFSFIKEIVITRFDIFTYFDLSFNFSIIDLNFRILFSTLALMFFAVILIYHAL